MMIRPFTLFCAFFAGVSGMVLYAQKHKTTQLDKEITKIVYDTQRIKSRTAMLRTEWTLLNQPDRLKDLSNHFIPNLRPLNPSQFVQMAAVTAVLPPVKNEPEKDKTREDLVKNVAQNNGQPLPTIAVHNTETTSPTITQPQQQVAKTTPITPNNKTTDVADATDTVETQKLKPQTVKKVVTALPKNNITTESVNTPAPVRRRKVKATEIADATDAVETQKLKPQTVKKNHIQNVSYNIQSENPFSHNKTARSKTTSAGQTNIINNETALDRKLSSKQPQQVSTNVPKKRPATIKVARNEGKRTNYSESALGGGANEALPAPVPFTR